MILSRPRKHAVGPAPTTNSLAALKVSKHLSARAQVGRCALLLVYFSDASAQMTSTGPALHLAQSTEPGSSAEPWTFSGSLYAYFPPDSGNYLQPTLTADR